MTVSADRVPRERVSRWGHDRDNPRLEVHCDRPPEKQFAYMKRGRAKIQAVFPRRQSCSVGPMWQRPQPLRELKRPRPHIIPGDLRYEVAWLRSDVTELDSRFADFLMLHHDVRTLEVGQWTPEGMRFWTRERMCELLGEGGLPLSLDQYDRLKRRFRARRWMWSKQQRFANGDGTYSSGPARIGISKKFLSDWGVLGGREKCIAKLELRAVQAERRRRGLDPFNPKGRLEVQAHGRRLARRMSWDERELGPYRDRVRRELPGLDDWALEREAQRRYKADNPGRGPPK